MTACYSINDYGKVEAKWVFKQFIDFTVIEFSRKNKLLTRIKTMLFIERAANLKPTTFWIHFGKQK